MRKTLGEEPYRNTGNRVRCGCCGKLRHHSTQCSYRNREYAQNTREGLGKDDDSKLGQELEQIEDELDMSVDERLR